jgi:hypothetical protein
MSGSFRHALLAAWQGIRGFEERASIRTWLYRLAITRFDNSVLVWFGLPRSLPDDFTSFVRTKLSAAAAT